MGINKFFLMRHDNGQAWYIVDADKCQTMENGFPAIAHTTCEYAAETPDEMLHDMYRKKDNRFYVTLGWINNRGITRHKQYPLYWEVHPLMGFVEEVYSISQDRHGHALEVKWEVDYVSELWVRVDEFTLKKVFGFDDMMQRAVDEFVAEHGLEYEKL